VPIVATLRNTLNSTPKNLMIEVTNIMIVRHDGLMRRNQILIIS
jgi:hypothetical protein